MNFDLVIIIIFVVCFTISLFQCIEFIQNYDYIQKFNDQYSKYEYIYTPVINYVDSTYFDPNDSETNVNLKWKCYNYNKIYYGVSQKGMIMKNNQFYSTDNYLDCINYIFSSYVINYLNPCNKDSDNNYCKIFKSIKWI